MMEITEEIRAWIDRNAGATELAADEYIDPTDGLIHYSLQKLQRPAADRCSQLRKAGIFHAPVCLPLSGRGRAQAQRSHSAAGTHGADQAPQGAGASRPLSV